MLNLAAIDKAGVSHDPFDFLLAPGVLAPSDLAAVRQDFPAIHHPGLFPPEALRFGPAFAELLDQLSSPEFAATLGRKFDLDLTGRPRMVTIRGQTQSRDGRIHADSNDKILTCLLYLNGEWDLGGGRLRFLRDGHDLENYVAEIPPHGGSFAAFRVTANSWHGHAPFVGARRSIMINWLRDDAAGTRNRGRHRISAFCKKFLPSLFKAR